jgi:serine/threonine protein kinase
MTATPLALILAAVIGVPLGIAVLVYLVVPVCKGGAWLITRVFTFIFREIGDVLRVVGSLLTALVLVPLTVGNVLIGRWSGASHYGRAIQGEFKALGKSLYRIAIGHPATLLCLNALTEGIEKRIPEVVAGAPGSDKPPRRVGQFEGYTIVGSLHGGGSGGKLYIADPTPEKLASLARSGATDVQQVVIKCFSLRDGSSLPQIVRENRALPAAKRLGLILEHELTDERFYYVMKYVPGDSLGIITQRLHAESGGDGAGGLAPKQLREAIEYAADLARTLCHYHDGGLWHKDVKPDNIIVAGGQAHLVDFGLITPLRSSMTLTTHGTEYFRDPEMVRLALRGVKVHEVDGAKFDIYAAGAVLYSVIENSFPAHGGLSQISRRCPEAIRWIVRRAMTDYDKRYASAEAMLRDLEAVLGASDPFTIKPAMLPSFREGDDIAIGGSARHDWEAASGLVGRSIPAMAGVGAAGGAVIAAAASPVPPAIPAGYGGGAPRLKVTSWWTGKYAVHPASPVVGGAAGSPANSQPRAPRAPRVPGATAAEQLSRARDRARAAQARAHSRMRGYSPEKFKPVNAGVGVAVVAFLVVVGALMYLTLGVSQRRAISISQDLGNGTSRVVRIGPSGIHIDTQEDPVEKTDAVGLPVTIDPAIRVERGVDRGQVMVLRDPVSFDTAVRTQIDSQITALRDSGFHLRGNYSAGASAADETEDEIMAELRSDLGVTPFSTPEAREVIEDWLDKYEQFNAVVWIGRADDSQPAAWVVGRRGLSDKAMDVATSVFTAVERRR